MSIPIQFDKPRTLKFDLAAIRDLEAALNGKPLGSVVSDISQLGVTAMVAALWAGLKHEDRGLSQNLVLKHLQTYIQNKRSKRVLARAINDALDETGLFSPEDEELEEGNVQPEPVTPN